MAEIESIVPEKATQAYSKIVEAFKILVEAEKDLKECGFEMPIEVSGNTISLKNEILTQIGKQVPHSTAGGGNYNAFR